MAAPDRLPDVHLVNPYRGGPVCRETRAPIYMTEDERLASCAACVSIWQHRDRAKGARRIGVGRMTE
jgi:hypothetical protein